MRRKGIYVEMAHHPQAILDAMVGMEEAVARTRVLQQLLRYLPIALLVIGFGGFFLGALGGIDQPVLVLLFFVMFAAGIILLGISGRWRIPMLQEHFDAAREILHTLRDDTGRKGRVVGWLDLSGPQQKEKTVRTARSGGGKRKVYYRDPWFKVKFKLVDGSLLRLTLEDKVKTKAGSIVRHQSQFSAKLVVNPDLYHLWTAAASEVPQHYTAAKESPDGSGADRKDDVLVLKRAGPPKGFTAHHEDGALVLKGASTAEGFSAPWVLETLRFAYSQLVDVEHPQSVFERLRTMAEKAEQIGKARQQQRANGTQQLLANFVEEVKRRGFEVSPRSDRLYYHPQIPDTRFALATRVVRLERKSGRRQRWDLVRSFSIAREIDLALQAADAMLAGLEGSG